MIILAFVPCGPVVVVISDFTEPEKCFLSFQFDVQSICQLKIKRKLNTVLNSATVPQLPDAQPEEQLRVPLLGHERRQWKRVVFAVAQGNPAAVPAAARR